MVKKVDTEKLEPKNALWELEISEVEGKSMERKGRDEINEMLSGGWIMLSVYTLRYKDAEDTWFERPMAILGMPKHPVKLKKKTKRPDIPEAIIH